MKYYIPSIIHHESVQQVKLKPSYLFFYLNLRVYPIAIIDVRDPGETCCVMRLHNTSIVIHYQLVQCTH